MGATAADLNEQIKILQGQLASAHTKEAIDYLQKRIRELKLRAFQLGFNNQKEEGDT